MRKYFPIIQFNLQEDGWMDGWMDGWVDGWMDGWMVQHLPSTEVAGRANLSEKKNNIVVLFL